MSEAAYGKRQFIVNKFFYFCSISLYSTCTSSGVSDSLVVKTRVPHPGPRGATERFSGAHEQRLLLNSSTVMLQNPIDEQGARSVDSLWMGVTNHEMLRTIGLDQWFSNCGTRTTSGTRRPSTWYAKRPTFCFSSQKIYSQL